MYDISNIKTINNKCEAMYTYGAMAAILSMHGMIRFPVIDKPNIILMHYCLCCAKRI